MSLPTDPYKGVRDFYPEDMALQRYIFDTWAHVAESYGFERYDASILEPAELYRAKTGEEIVSEQTYTFVDRGDREVTLRPEMTPSVARMVAARRRELSFPLRWYSIPNLFRYERPQRGRLREHWQLNCDIFGTDSVAAEIEVILLARSVFLAFGAQDEDFVIYINDRAMLNEYFASLSLTPDQTYRMYKLLDRKDKMDITAFEAEAGELLGRPFSSTELDSLMSERLAACVSGLTELGVANVEVKQSIVRGLDYYTGIVFEIFDTNPENHRALFGGGRYDNLTELFGDDPIPAVGFGMGDVTMRDFLTTRNLVPKLEIGPSVLLLPTDGDMLAPALAAREVIRQEGVSAAVDLSGKKLKDQLARAAKAGVRYAVIVGPDEVASSTYTLKELASGTETKGTILELLAQVR